MSARLLLVEDEVALAETLRDYLEREGHEVVLRHDAHALEETILAGGWDLVLLDLNLPGGDGVEICRAVRARSTVPIIIVTARVAELERLLGFDAGADDYVCKPCSPREIVARVRSLLRRASGEPAADGRLRLDPATLGARLDGRPLALNAIEWRILAALAVPPPRVRSRDALMDAAYPDGRAVNDRTIDSHVNKLRRKREAAGGARAIGSVYGVGYRLEDG